LLTQINTGFDKDNVNSFSKKILHKNLIFLAKKGLSFQRGSDCKARFRRRKESTIFISSAYLFRKYKNKIRVYKFSMHDAN